MANETGNRGKQGSLTQIFSGEDAASEVMVNFGQMAIHPLIKVLRDSNINVRFSAVRALGRLQAKEAVGPIIELYGREGDARFRGCIVVALTQIGTDEVKKLLIDIFETEKDERVRCLIVTSVGILKDANGLPLLKRALLDKDARVRANAVESLARIKGVAANDLIRALLSDPNNRVRANVCKVLWHSDPANVLKSLRQMLFSEREVERMSAAYAMGEIAHPQVLPLLLERLKVEEDPKTREHICEALGKIGEMAVAPLKEILSLENNLNVLFALQAINRKRRSTPSGERAGS